MVDFFRSPPAGFCKVKLGDMAARAAVSRIGSLAVRRPVNSLNVARHSTAGACEVVVLRGVFEGLKCIIGITFALHKEKNCLLGGSHS